MKHSISLPFILLLCVAASIAQDNMIASKRVRINHVASDFAITELNSDVWEKASEVTIGNYWSGAKAPPDRHFKARLVWSETALYVRFEANQAEPLVVNDRPDVTAKTVGLWERDVCEIFIAPNKADRNKYFEFEIAPTGEWIDLGITVTPKRRITDLEYTSGMRSSVSLEPKKVVMAIKIEWKAFGKTPKTGDIWLGNLFRCVGKDPSRGYLSWQATNTKTPNFHVPSKFGEFEFVG